MKADVRSRLEFDPGAEVNRDRPVFSILAVCFGVLRCTAVYL
jgi:hypothetical protein